jgi:hypothetical protein
MEKQIKYFYKQLLTMIGLYYKISFDNELVFTRNQIFNISEQIDNCIKSMNLISIQTILENHPWVTDVIEEQKRLNKEIDNYNKKQNDSRHGDLT